MELYPTSLRDIAEGHFPLNHDCILKVVFFPDSGMRYQYFSCRAQDSGSLADILCKIFCVSKVLITDIDNLYL